MLLGKDVSVINFSGIYESEDFWKQFKNPRFIDCSDLSGTDCICDDYALSSIKERLKDNQTRPEGIHFIDSGNYHYMSHIMTSLITEDFVLVYFDHHPDMKPSVFGDVLSCGSWVRNSLISSFHMKRVYGCGIDERLIEELGSEITEPFTLEKRLEFCSPKGICGASFDDLPIYLSIDKDVLSPTELRTNWDQGDMTFDLLKDILTSFVQNENVIGIDICGEPELFQKDIDVAKETKKSSDINKQIIDICLNS